jgi:hypothetical protein
MGAYYSCEKCGKRNTLLRSYRLEGSYSSDPNSKKYFGYQAGELIEDGKDYQIWRRETCPCKKTEINLPPGVSLYNEETRSDGILHMDF